MIDEIQANDRQIDELSTQALSINRAITEATARGKSLERDIRLCESEVAATLDAEMKRQARLNDLKSELEAVGNALDGFRSSTKRLRDDIARLRDQNGRLTNQYFQARYNSEGPVLRQRAMDAVADYLACCACAGINARCEIDGLNWTHQDAHRLQQRVQAERASLHQVEEVSDAA